MVAHGRGILSDHVNTGEIARHWVSKMRRMLARSMETRSSASADAFLDVSYYDFLTTPIEEVRKIYVHAGIVFSEEAELAATAISAGDVKDRHGKHIYSLSSLGLNADQVDEAYAFYRRAFRISDEDASVPGAR